MKFEVGKSFATRLNEKLTVVEIRWGGTFPIIAKDSNGNVTSYTKDGRWRGDGTDHSADLIAEWRGEPATDDARAVVEKELRSLGVDPASVLRPAATAGPILLDWSATASTEYAPLAAILQEAYDQAATGKGKERHANDRAFIDQPILEIGRMCGPGFNTGQSIKKQQEAMGMIARGHHSSAIRELLGAINYAASAILLIREQNPDA